MIYSLRLMSGNESLNFQSSLFALRRRLSSAFWDMKRSTSIKQAVLEVYHPVHGWNQVYIHHRSPIIDNPFVLDFALMRQAILATLAECDSWPTEEQKAQRRALLLSKERDVMAKQRRKQFTVVQGTKTSPLR